MFSAERDASSFHSTSCQQQDLLQKRSMRCREEHVVSTDNLLNTDKSSQIGLENGEPMSWVLGVSLDRIGDLIILYSLCIATDLDLFSREVYYSFIVQQGICASGCFHIVCLVHVPAPNTSALCLLQVYNKHRVCCKISRSGGWLG